ncbi:MAG: TolC family protein [Chitinophagaceae bacterium]|nr:TolC family protein [Chitinophagaceae bacterium]
MRKFRIALCLVLLMTSAGYKVIAQKKYELTVKEAVDMAFKNVTEIKNAMLDVDIQRAQNKEITGQALPQLTGSASLSRYLELPQILFPDGSQTGIYNVLINEGLLPQSTKVPAPALRPVSFFQPWNASASANLSQLLFQPDVFVGLQARKTAINYSKANLEVVKERIKDSAYRRYYAILIAQKQSEFLQGGIERLQKLYHDDSVMYKNGFAEKLDLDKVQVQLTNLQTSQIVLHNSIALAYAALKYAIGANQTDTVVLNEALSNEELKENILDESFTYADRKEYKLLDYTKQLQVLSVRRYKLAYLPTLSTAISYTAQGQGQKFITDKNTFWLRNSLASLNLSVPIFDGFQRKYKVQQAQLNLQKVNNSVDNLKQVIDLQKTITKESLTNALLNLDAQERNVQLAETVYNTTKKKFEAGIGSSFEVLQADNDWQTAQSNYFNSLYNAVVARIGFLSALGKLQ